MQKKLAAMEFLKFVAERVYRGFRRVFPRCGMISQAIAFNLFLAFFPTLLIAVALATSPVGGRTSLLELIRQITGFLPPGSQQIVSEYLTKRGPEVWKWALAGLTGTLLAGSQVMKLVMQGIQVIYGEEDRMGWLHRQVRGLVLILVTIAPLLAAAILGVLGRPLRRLLAHVFRTDRKSTRLNSSHDQISYAVFCLKKQHSLEDALSRSRSRLLPPERPSLPRHAHQPDGQRDDGRTRHARASFGCRGR